MADTRVQLEVEDWVRREWLPAKLGERFSRERIKLSPGGVFDFDAVSADFSIVANISTSSARTASDKLAVGKLMKLRSDMYFLLLAACKRRFVVLTDRTMFELCQKERDSGRVPESIEFLHAELPESLRERLRAAQLVASDEVAPARGRGSPRRTSQA